MIFAACALLWTFANAPLLPLVGQKLAFQFPREATAMLSFCMVAAQGVMMPIAIFVGRNADRLGRRPIFLIAFTVLPIRAALYIVSNNAFWLLGVQLLDGVGAGIYEALTPLVIADIMRGTGRYNLAQGAVATTQGVGAAISGLAAGVVTDHFGYSVSFLFLASAAAVALALFLLLMPETRDDQGFAREAGALEIRPANEPDEHRRSRHPRPDLCRRRGRRRPRASPRSGGHRLPRRRGDDRARPLEPRARPSSPSTSTPSRSWSA